MLLGMYHCLFCFQYLEKKKEMKQSGYTERELADSFAFLLVESDEEVCFVLSKKWCVSSPEHSRLTLSIAKLAIYYTKWLNSV